MLRSSSCLFLLVVFTACSTANADCPHILTRALWGGNEAKKIAYLTNPVSYVIIHHTVTPPCLELDTCATSVRTIQTFHMNKLRFDDIGYSFLIGGDGNVYEGRGWNKVGAHTLGWNSKSVAIGFIGNYEEVEPDQKMLDAARELIACGKSQDMLSNNVKVLGARQIRATISPGEKLYSKIQNLPEWSATP